jgi:hypothetical protein
VSFAAPCGLPVAGLKKSFMLNFRSGFFSDFFCGLMFTRHGYMDSGVVLMLGTRPNGWSSGRARFRPRVHVLNSRTPHYMQWAAASLTTRHASDCWAARFRVRQ